MNLFRLSIIAVSAALTFSVGSSASTANTSYSPPEFSVAENRTLNLRETGLQIVVETIENALRAGGLALLGKGFQLDSSLSYHSGDNEGIEGNLDVVIPLLNLGRHVVFAQPGAVFWTGIEEERIDGNIGLVYRAELIRDLVAGASVFYDHDFHIGHSRVGGGIDLQSGFFRFGANYYHPLGEEEDGREGFIEEALRGMDARLVFEKDVVRLGSTVGYWDYEDKGKAGGEDSQSGWKTSIGLDAGVRILPGVFAEASWERHKDDIVLDERIFAGLAFRFSLPDFEGASYGDGSMSANLYKAVDREKRILYEERAAFPTVSLALPDGVSADVEEGDTVNVQIQLSEALNEDVNINLVGSGSAEYGSSNDYTVSVGGMACTRITEDNCQVMIDAGDTSATVQVSISEDGGGESPETIVLSTTIALARNTNLMPGGSLVLTIPVDQLLPTVSLNYSGALTRVEGISDPRMSIELSEAISEPVMLNLSLTGTAQYGNSGFVNMDDWQLYYNVIPSEQMSPDNFDGTNRTSCGTNSNPSCQIAIARGETTVDVSVSLWSDGRTETPETAIISISIPSQSQNFIALGDMPRVELTITD